MKVRTRLEWAEVVHDITVVAHFNPVRKVCVLHHMLRYQMRTFILRALRGDLLGSFAIQRSSQFYIIMCLKLDLGAATSEIVPLCQEIFINVA